MTQRILRYSALGLAVLTVGAMAACGSSDSPAPTNNTTAGAAPGTAGSGNAGAANPGTAGATANAGSTGSTAGSANAGASSGGGSAGAGFTCAGGKPAAPLITEFADLVANPTSTGN
ncbi:MAG: hypothetical protein ABW061_00270, partial [Polyangiaceae bacterium]